MREPDATAHPHHCLLDGAQRRVHLLVPAPRAGPEESNRMCVHQLQVLCTEFEAVKGHFPARPLDQELCECGDPARRHEEAAHPDAAHAGEVAHVQSSVGACFVFYACLNTNAHTRPHFEHFE